MELLPGAGEHGAVRLRVLDVGGGHDGEHREPPAPAVDWSLVKSLHWTETGYGIIT